MLMKKTTRERFAELAARGTIVPVYREIPGDMETPVSVLSRFAQDPYAVLLESVEGGENLGRFSFLGVNPYAIFSIEGRGAFLKAGGERRELSCDGTNPLTALRPLIGADHVAVDPELPPLPGGAIGFLSYEAAGFFEELPPPKGESGVPAALFLLTDEIIAFDNRRHTIKVIVNVRPENFSSLDTAYTEAQRRIDLIVAKLRLPAPLRQTAVAAGNGVPAELRPEISREAFLAMVEKAKRHIVEGDIIQVVPSQAFSAECSIPPFDIYRALRLVNPSPYMFYFKAEGEILIGSSPETLVKLVNGVSEIRPIAGTRPRGRDAAEDRAMEESLLADEKERAEHLMLVDLGRNDIGRTAEAGSVKVPEFMKVERYSHVMHLVSRVTGQLRDDFDAFDLAAAAFPAGTLSGAPKIRAMEIIRDLEAAPRGVYGGAVGYFSYDGNMDLAITIRTLEVRDGRIKVQAGAGIVADSVPESEYQETLNKARALFQAVEFAGRGLQ